MRHVDLKQSGMEIVAPVNLIILLSIGFTALMFFVMDLEFDKNPAEEERKRKMKEYKEFFHI